jgi:hypothetical protein
MNLFRPSLSDCDHLLMIQEVMRKVQQGGQLLGKLGEYSSITLGWLRRAQYYCVSEFNITKSCPSTYRRAIDPNCLHGPH